MSIRRQLTSFEEIHMLKKYRLAGTVICLVGFMHVRCTDGPVLPGLGETPGDTAGSSTPDAGQGDASDPPPALPCGLYCGNRSVFQTPTTMVIEEKAQSSPAAMTPQASPLGLAFYGGFCHQDDGMSYLDQYEVDPVGNIVGRNTRFIITDCCLRKESDNSGGGGGGGGGSGGGADSLPPGWGSPWQTHQACGPGEFPLGHNGLGDTGPGYICVRLAFDVCRDCWRVGDTWHERFTIRMTLTALSSIDGVAVDGSCNGGVDRVDILSGDAVTITTIHEIEYRRMS